MRVVLLLALAACSLTPGDYRDPLVGGQAAAAVEQCKADRYQPCGWVRAYVDVERDNPLGVLELCVPWPDRIGPPVGIERAMESLWGESVPSWDERFAGTPLCRWQCPTTKGCNAYDGCACLDGARDLSRSNFD